MHKRNNSGRTNGRPRRRGERGSFMLETAVVIWALLFMLIGAFQMGVMLTRAIQAGEACRNANVLQVRSIDLSQTQNQELLLRTAPMLGLNQAGSWLPSSTGSGVIILSRVYLVGPLECSNGVANFDGTTNTCPNLGSYVITYRVTIGNPAKGQSTVGNPVSAPAADGTLTDNEICTNTGNVTLAFPNVLALGADQFTWVAEVFADSASFNLFPLMRAPTIYMRNLS